MSTPAPDLDRPDAVLFDIDGTVVDSNYLHVQAWSLAFAEVDHPVPSWRIHRAIGRDSAELLDALLGEDVAARVGDDAKDAHSRHYGELADQLRVLPGARSLLDRLAADGVAVVLATSAPPDELEVLRRVLDVEDDLAATTDAGDVGSAKPEPDIVEVALARAGVPAGRAVFVGDTIWDVAAAARAGVPCLGVRSGGVAPAELTDAGAVGVYDDVAHLERSLTGERRPWLGAP